MDPHPRAPTTTKRYSEFFRTLFIGEDCSQHVNCMVWAHNVDTAEQTRMLTVPAGAEATGLGVYDDLNGFTYLTASFQHAGELFTGAGKLHNNVATAVLPLIKDNYNNLASSPVGYLQSVSQTTGVPVTQMQATVTSAKAAGSPASDLNTWTAANAGGLAAGVACLAFIIGSAGSYFIMRSAKAATPALKVTEVAKGAV